MVWKLADIKSEGFLVDGGKHAPLGLRATPLYEATNPIKVLEHQLLYISLIED